MTTTEYVIYLAGSTNAYNSGPGPVGIYSGTGKTACEREQSAIAAAEEDGVIAYNGQYLSATPYARCSAEDKDAAWSDQETREFQKQQALATVGVSR